MFNIFSWYSDYKLRKLQLKLDAANKPYEVMAGAVAAQSEFLKAYFNSFKVTELPTSSIIRDEDEYEAEQARLSGRVEDAHAALTASMMNAAKANAWPELEKLLREQAQ